MNISQIVRTQRKLKRLSQVEFAIKCGVGLRFIRELEQGKKTLRLDKVNQVLNYLGYEVGAIKQEPAAQLFSG